MHFLALVYLFLCVFQVQIHGLVSHTWNSVTIHAAGYRQARNATEIPTDDQDSSGGSEVGGDDYYDDDDKSCTTFDNQPGICRTAKQCYPYFRLHDSIDNLESWVLGTKGRCNYQEPSGRQVYGVCCSHGPVDGRTDEPFSQPQSHLIRIVNGVSARFSEYPFMAGISKNGRVYCGASLIDESHVLTAAHCVYKITSMDLKDLKIILGATNLGSDLRTVKSVRSITRHRLFDPVKLVNDIAIMTLDTPVQYSNVISPVCLPNDRNSNYVGVQGEAIGWGRLFDGGPRTDQLQKVALEIKDQEDCRRNLGSKAPGGIPDSFMCAWNQGKDSCAGDSGGPLLINNCQVAIVSWGIGCATENYGVYTRVSSFRTWIDKNRYRF